MSIWLGMIILHTVCAVTCFISGLILMSPQKAKSHPSILTVFIASLVGLIIFMLAATISHWNELGVAERIAFSGLPLLGAYMLYRAINATKDLRENNDTYYIDGIGFSLISLLNGFVIVALIDLGFNPISIPVVAILGTLIGTRYVKRMKIKHATASINA